MWTWIQQELGTGLEARALALLADVGLKGIVLMALASLAAFAMKRSTASARHLVYLLALGGLLFLPFVSLLVPMWQLPILPASEPPAVPAPRSLNAIPDTPTTGPAPAPKTAPMNVPTTPLPVEADKRAPVIATPTPAVPYVEESTPVDTSTPTRVAGWLLAAWLVMVIILLFPLLAGLGALRRMTRNATPFTGDALPQLTQELAHALELRRPVRLLRAPAGTMPMAAGLFRGVVFLPAEAESWSDEKRRAVLLHELAHVKRRDCLTHALALLAVALHWFNPFAWLALRQLRVEREHACDDLVLTAGERPAEYAEVLLDVARSLRAGTLASAAAITMAKKSHLEGRLLAVLDEARKRTRMTRRAILGFALVGALLTAALSTLHVTRAESKAVVDHLTFSSGVEVTLLGVGPPRDDNTPPWKPDGTPLNDPPEIGPGSYMTPLHGDSRLVRQFYQRTTTPDDLPAGESVSIRYGGLTRHNIPAGDTTVVSVAHRMDEDASRVDIDVGVAAGAWEPLAQTIAENGAQGTRKGVTYNILVGKPFKRDDAYHFTLTHDVVDLDKRVVVYDSLGKMHYTPGTGTSPGSGGTHMGEYSQGDVAPEEVRAVELQVREFEWRKFRNIPVNPEATIPPSDDVEEAPATQDPSTPEESRYTATFSPDLQARIAGVGQPDEYTVSSVWAPDGAPMAGIPEGFATKMGGSSSDKSGIKRRFFIEVSPVPEESDLGIKFKVEGNSVAHNVRKSRDKAFISAEIYNLPDTRDDTSFELGIAFGPWESLYGTMGPHSSSEGSESGAAFSDFFEKEGRPHVVVTHTPREDDFRLVVFDGDDTAYASRQVSSFGVGGMHQTEFVVEEDIRSSELIYMDFQARPFEWRTLSNIAIHPDDSDATGSADDPPVAKTPPTAEEEPKPPSSTNAYGLKFRANEIVSRSDDERVTLVRHGSMHLRVDAAALSTEDTDLGTLAIEATGSADDPPRLGMVLSGGSLDLERLEYVHGLDSGRAGLISSYILQRGWDGALVSIPAAVTVPRAMMFSKAWREWAEFRNSQQVAWVDELGRRYVVHAFGWARSGLKSFPVIPRMERFRPDGTLECYTVFEEEHPIETTFFAADGKTMTQSARLLWTGIDGAPCLQDFTWRAEDGTYRSYDATAGGVIKYESVGGLDENNYFRHDLWVCRAPEAAQQTLDLDSQAAIGGMDDFTRGIPTTTVSAPFALHWVSEDSAAFLAPWHEESTSPEKSPGLWLEPTALLSDGAIDSVQADSEENNTHASLRIRLTADGRDRLHESSAEGVGRQLAILVAGEVVLAPIVQAPISNGEIRIVGEFTRQTAQRLADALRPIVP